uniref:Aminotransferase class V-fold PLP-dependent enzyme n=1 Tax=Acidobacterium capsulatum TaxID=33075 RepID=A0A7V4XRI3_9BACT
MADCPQPGLPALPLTEARVQQNFAPLFSRVLAEDRIYLMTQSLGRPLDRMAEDVREAMEAWYMRMGSQWDDWLAAREHYRSLLACLTDAGCLSCVVPMTSAGEGLRTVLNALTATNTQSLDVLTTTGEFTSTQVVLEQYAAAGRIRVRRVKADKQGYFSLQTLMDAVTAGTGLVVVSEVMFQTGQWLRNLDQLADTCHAKGARLLVDAYHSLGAVPVDVRRMRTDFMTGGCYKYLRGGPGAAFLYLSPEVLESGPYAGKDAGQDSGLVPLDAGWFALKPDRATDDFSRAALMPGGNAFLQDTPGVLPWYQARSGLEFTLEVGISRLRAYGLEQLRFLRAALEDAGVQRVHGADDEHGAFLVVRHAKAALLAEALREQQIMVNARGECLRLCPDCLTRQEELLHTAATLGKLMHEIGA